MGLLDDAIREHLEFKRLRGADPGALAHEEHEALGPVHRGQEPEPQQREPEEHPGTSDDDSRGERPIEAFPPGSGSFVPTGQETAELDMQAVLRTEQQDEPPMEDSLEWEVPSESPSETSQGTPSEDEDQREGSVEDVLEETPDFLRETPDQERLWFEQQPPRDFDFDK
jgi:hypothetical protein